MDQIKYGRHYGLASMVNIVGALRVVGLLGLMTTGQLHGQVQTPSPDSLSLMIGQMICLGLGEEQVLAGDEPWVADAMEGKLGGIILYEKNILSGYSAEALRALIGTAQLAARTPLWIAIDEEGGQVSRLKPKYGFMVTATAQELGALGVSSTVRQAENMAKQLADLGVNLNFAPVIDLALNPKSTVIYQTKRAYSADPKVVAAHARAFLKAMRQHNIVGVVKHFPGHGSAAEDTHLGLVDVSNTWQLQEIVPYSQLVASGDVQAVMSAHVVNSKLDRMRVPATLSAPMLQDLLRGIIRFEGVIFSDDLQMQAITQKYALREAVFLALKAGVDVLLFCNNLPNTQMVQADQIHAIISDMIKQGHISEARIRDSYRRIMRLKQAYGLAEHRL